MRHFLAAGALCVATIFTVSAHAETTSAEAKTHANHATEQAEPGAAAKLGDLEITSGWARATLPGQKAAGAYLIISNAGTAADKLIGAASPSADKTEIHTMEIVNDVMTMRPVEGGLEIPAGGSVELKPGGYHIMFMGISEPFAEGTAIPVELQFETAGDVALELPVRLVKGQEHDHTHNHEHGHEHGDGHDQKHKH